MAGVPVPDSLRTARETVAPALRTAVERLHPGLRDAAGYHLGWLDAAGRPAAARTGKALRPALVLLSGRAGGSEPDDALAPAVAVELVHNSSLLHDDLIDRDDERHGRPTAWVALGPAAAVLAGDALLNLAYEVVADGTAGGQWATRCLAAATGRMLAGQAADVAFETRTGVRVDECLAMAADKTGALLSCAATIGCMYVGGPSATAVALAAYGQQLGLAFQLVDDLLGVWGAPGATGKPVLADLRVRKKSLPVVYALAAGGSPSEELAALYARTDLDEDGLRRCAELVEKAGGRAWAEARADEARTDAEAALASADLPADVADELLAVVRFATARDR